MRDGKCVMAYKVKGKSEESANRDSCPHYWMIEGAHGSMSHGVCKFCGAKKKFYNSLLGSVPVKKNTSVLELPELPKVELAEEQAQRVDPSSQLAVT